MMDKLHFPSRETAQQLRDEYFLKYHSTAKVRFSFYHLRLLYTKWSQVFHRRNLLILFTTQGLTAAEADGRLPLPPDGAVPPGEKLFKPRELDEYWATNLDFSMLRPLDQRSLEIFESLSRSHIQIVAFSNGPRLYVERVLKEIGVARYFDRENLFAVTDVLPHCKPDRGSFELVLNRVGAMPEQCIMVEDSMKNIRAAKELGMKTILIMGEGRKRKALSKPAEDAEATKVGDAPDDRDPAVDAAVETVAEIDSVLREWMVLPATG
jgi:putative hydrolase of the HAD superfamily